MVTAHFQKRGKKKQTEVTKPLHLEERTLLEQCSFFLCSVPAFVQFLFSVCVNDQVN